MTPGRDPAAGVTLVEMVVALAIFALIGSAGYAMLDQVLRTESRTSGRLERLGDLQRALFLVGQDFAQGQAHSVAQDGGGVTVGRDGAVVRYHLAGNALRRDVADAAGASRAEQVLVADVQAVRWRFLDGRGAWVSGLPSPGAGRPRNPQAVEMVLTLPGGQDVRRVAVLPAEAD
ncbi:MAG: type II secretion system protein GspJ [Gemmobacter sp.]